MSYPDVESVSSRPAASCSPPKNLKAVRFTSPVESKMYAASADESLGQNMSMNETPSLASILRSFAGADTSSDDREMLRVLIKCKTREDERKTSRDNLKLEELRGANLFILAQQRRQAEQSLRSSGSSTSSTYPTGITTFEASSSTQFPSTCLPPAVEHKRKHEEEMQVQDRSIDYGERGRVTHQEMMDGLRVRFAKSKAERDGLGDAPSNDLESSSTFPRHTTYSPAIPSQSLPPLIQTLRRLNSISPPQSPHNLIPGLPLQLASSTSTSLPLPIIRCFAPFIRNTNCTSTSGASLLEEER